MAAYIQRIYDSGSPPEVPPRWVYYTKGSIDPSPLPGETSPVHTGNLVTATHEVLEELVLDAAKAVLASTDYVVVYEGNQYLVQGSLSVETGGSITVNPGGQLVIL